MQASQYDISDVGRVLIDVIDDQPGIHFRALERAANLNSAGQLRHHVDRLLRHKLIVEYEEGGYKRFFLNGHHDPQLLPRIARFARPVPRRIAKLLLVRPLSRTELRRRLGCADSTLGYHLTRMTLLGDVIKHRRCNSCHYSLADPDGVRAALDALEGNGSNEPDGGAAAAAASTRREEHPFASVSHGRPAPIASRADPVPRVGRQANPPPRVPYGRPNGGHLAAGAPRREPVSDAISERPAPRRDADQVRGRAHDADDTDVRHLYGERRRWARRSTSETTSVASA